MSSLNLHLDKLKEGVLPGLNTIWGSFLWDASVHCFFKQNHATGIAMNVNNGKFSNCFSISWNSEVSNVSINAWNDEQELTEYGASGIAIPLVVELTEYSILQRSRKGTGIDYWLTHKDSSLPFENAARLEVSGIMKGSESQIKTRVKVKKEQTAPSDGELPVYVIVVEFSRPVSHMIQK